MSDLLNPSQRAAVEHELGPMLVLAGAGSGKTRVVTTRIARLLDRGIPARSMLAMTFTNKAAAEMHERVGKLVGSKVARELKVCTFHRFGLDVLGAETRALGLRGGSFAIFDQSDALGVIREILRELRAGKSYDVSAILSRISNAKNAFLDAETWAEAQRQGKGIDDYDEISMLVYPRYMAALRSFQAFDFDDLICEVVRLWQARADVLERWRMRYRFVIVDEYQDTNRAQLELLRLLCGEHRNVVVVGDDDQSIYAWRGADVRNILDFEEHFSGAKVVKLEHNYRSRKPILDVANAVLAKSGARRHKKSLIATRVEGDKVRSIICVDPDVEASFVATEAQRLLEREAARPKDIAVLYRSNLQAAAIESALKERQIPIRMIGGQQFFERKEVKDLIAYLRVALNPGDEMCLRRILNYPARGIGDVAVAKLGAYATAHDATLWTAVSRPHAVHELTAAAIEGCRQLLRIIEATRARFERGEPSAEVSRALLADAGFKEDIMAGSSTANAAARRWGNIEGLLNVFARRDEKGKGDRASFAEFLRLLALRQDSEEEEATDRVTLTTMHGAKGLEFPYVFVIGLEEGLMPHQRSLDERATDAAPSGAEGGDTGGHSIEEERRLFYVAVTRARDRLYLTRAKHRGSRGKMVPRTPSRFMLEIPPELLEEREELAPVAPGMEKVKAGAAGVLAALSMNPFAGDPPLIPRRRS
ncbi:UvrD-helicase domain-containing protein [Sorangium sp. So ce726]|uniref:ATP-dependent helicase n=1 Tax=Sorangium sp. So ce726 TaxID=3133319 RepID=UPI003F5EE3C5